MHVQEGLPPVSESIASIAPVPGRVNKAVEGLTVATESTPVAPDGATRSEDWPNDLGFHWPLQNNEPQELKLTGVFPRWASGTLLRIGPGANQVDRENPKDGVCRVSHWFDGFTTCHKFVIDASEQGPAKVTYMSKGHLDKQIEEARKTGNLAAITFGQKRDPCDSFYKKMKTFFTPVKKKHPELENVGVAFAPAHHAKGKGLINTTSDRATLKEIDLESLEPRSVTTQNELNPLLKGPLSAAHPCHDPKNGDLYNYNLDFGQFYTYRVYRTAAADGKTEILATITGRDVKGAYIHSLFLTEHFVVLCVWPACFSMKGVSILWERNILNAIAPFNKNAECTWYVIDRVSNRGLVKKLTSPAMFAFHTINAWEDTQKDGSVDIIADLCEFENTDILHCFYYENLMSSGSGAARGGKAPVSFARYRLSAIPSSDSQTKDVQKDGVAKKIKSYGEPLCGELPCINPAYRTKPSRFVYSVIDRGLSSFVDAVGKTDTETGECKLWSQDKHTPGEPIFVANPNGEAEDDGVLLVVVLDGVKGTSYLLCLDATSMEEIARAECDVPVGFSFHGVHLKAR